MPTKSPADGTKTRSRRSATESHAKPSTFYRATTVQDRISQWQEHGAALAPAPDAVSVVSAPDSEASVAPAIAPSDLLHAIEAADAHRDSAERRSTAREHARRIRSSSTPRKRVVSDEHWRSNRAAKHGQKPSPQPATPPIELSDREHETNHLQSESPKTIRPRSSHDARAEREERRRRRLEARSKKTDSARKERSQRHSTRSPHEQLEDRSQFEPQPARGETPDNRWDESADVSPQRSRSPSQAGSDVQEPQADVGPWKKSRYAEALEQPPPAYSQDVPVKSKKGSFLNKTKERLGLSDPVPRPSNRLPSIEAWLYDQPDPFGDAGSASVKVEMPPSASAKKRSVRWETPERSSMPDPNQIWDAIGTLPDHSHPSEHDAPSSGARSDPRQHNSTSPAGLTRQKKRAARPRRHTVAQTFQEESRRPTTENETIEETLSAVLSTARQEEAFSPNQPTRLPTAVSTETLRHEPPLYEESIVPEPCELKRRLTTHEDMMSVLSMPTSRRGTRRKRSTKTEKRVTDSDAVNRVLGVMADDEVKYNRELKTLVDGVIPVLLQCVLSKTDAVAAAGLFTHSTGTNDDLTFTRTVIDMGVALERIKALHNRIPLHNVDSLLSWCHTAHRAYSDYLKAWKLGFQDIVIDLAPLEEPDTENNEDGATADKKSKINADENTADVTHLMKRPLVQIRKLGKGLNELKDLMPDHPVATKIAESYDELTAAAKAKHQQEKGRLEDEAAAYIDATKCRDIRTMAPLPGVVIDKTRRVRARDCFNLTLFHSSGQRMDCRIELILRDNHHTSPDGGDMLICQVEEAGKWLLFMPVDVSMVSARKGEKGCDLVVMIRGLAGIGKEWHELLALQAEDPEAAAEWMMMLGSRPLPPKLDRVPSFIDRKVLVKDQDSTAPAIDEPQEHNLKRIPSIESVDLPIGEPSVLGIAPSKEDKHRTQVAPTVAQKNQPQLSLGGGLSKKTIPEHLETRASIPSRHSAAPSIHSSDRSTVSGWSAASSTAFAPSSLAPAYFSNISSGRSDRDEPRPSKHVSFQTNRASSSPTTRDPTSQEARKRNSASQVETSKTQKDKKQNRDKVSPSVVPEPVTPKRPTVTRAPSSAPSQDLPSISKSRDVASKASPGSTPLTESIRDTWATISGLGRKVVSQPTTPTDSRKSFVTPPGNENKPLSQQTAPESDLSDIHIDIDDVIDETPPPPPQHKELSVLGPRSRNVPILRPSAAQQKMDQAKGRLSSSPLRNEYAPSIPSASASEDDRSQHTSDDDDYDSQTSEEFGSEQFDIAMPLASPLNKRQYLTGGAFAKATSAPTTGTRSLAPSDSASQGPYRRVPSSAERPDVVKKRASAMVCSWSESGDWTPVCEGYCLLTVSPGLIEAFRSNDSSREGGNATGELLVAFELTPLVPLRRPTGLDISIRSPPTASSPIQTTNNIMFRSHSVSNCDQLYGLINWARCNNLTYMELERSRPRPQPAVTFSNQEAPRPRSWFSFGSGGLGRRNSYRVGNVPPSSMGESQATTNTVSSAMSALKRLSMSSMFNVKRSSVMQRPGLTTNASLYSSSNETGSGSGASTPPVSQIGAVPGKDGPNVPATSAAAVNGGGMVHNMKIKLLVRKGRDWMPLGIRRLSVLPGVSRRDETPETSRPSSSGGNTQSAVEPSRRVSAPPGSIAAGPRQYRLPSADFTPHRLHGDGREKRIVITANGKPSDVMLDVTLGESCFEKIAHLGIAMQVWKEDENVKNRGGVVLGQNTVYMIQFYQQQDCAWVFGLVGSYRYGHHGNP